MFVATIFRIFGAFTSKNHFKKSISKPYQVRWSICPRSLKIIQDSLKSDLCPNCKFRSRRSSLSTVDFTHKKTILVHLWIPHLIAPCLNALNIYCQIQGCIFRLTCSHPELTEDHVLTSAYVKIFRTVTRNATNKSVWRKKDCFWLP